MARTYAYRARADPPCARHLAAYLLGLLFKFQPVVWFFVAELELFVDVLLHHVVERARPESPCDGIWLFQFQASAPRHREITKRVGGV